MHSSLAEFMKDALRAVACAALAWGLHAAPARAQTARPTPPATAAATPAAPRPSNDAPQPPTPEPQQPGARVSPEEADLSITANVRARELTFEVVPNPRVEFPGRPERRTL